MSMTVQVPNLDGRNFSADEVLVWHSPAGHPLVKLPVLTVACPYCGNEATPGTEGVSVSRICGDSANGYEAWHNACLDGDED